MTGRLNLAWMLALGVPLTLLAGAYIGEYGFGLYPCEMCWWQRYAHFAAAGLALLAWFVPARRALVALAGFAIFVSAVIGLFHAGVEYHWWQGFTTCTVPVTAAGGDALDAILNAPLVRCDTAQWTLFGISFAGWNFVFSGATALAIGWLLAQPAASLVREAKS